MALSLSRRLTRRLAPFGLTIALGAALLAAPAAADEPPAAAPLPASSPGSAKAPVDSTQMIGSLPPEVVGRWLFVIRATTDVGEAASVSQSTTDDNGKTTTITRTQEGAAAVPMLRTIQLSGKDKEATLVLHPGPFPDDLQKQVLADAGGPSASATPGPLSPPAIDAKSLAEVGRRWSELARPPSAPRLVTSKLLDYRSVSDEDKQRLGVPSAQLIIVTDEAFEGNNSLLKNVSTFAVEQMTPQRLEGQFLGAMIMPPLKSANMAIPPVPLVLKGRFVAYNLDAVAGAGSKPGSTGATGGAAPATTGGSAAAPKSGGSLVERLLGMFSGCGGR